MASGMSGFVMHLLFVLFAVFTSVIGKCSESICSEGQTCCENWKSWECCPLPNAVCCSDGFHCCPQNYVCNLTTLQCNSEQNPERVYFKTVLNLKSAFNKMPNFILCPDSSVCSTGSTCCHRKGSGYDCCPYPNASCCADMQHCCPSGSDCDSTSQYCIRKNSSTPVSATLFNKF
ncbi:progranulin isoform X2 [Parasteatoda tepidariorum]|uniref:progranulin isoform X2 n=1 Tax=Parasteatoda tepidariorum TaxID=114398 RepID=UPI0039BC8040